MVPPPPTVRLGVAQIDVSTEVPTAERLAAAGLRIRTAMAEARAVGARIVQFPEGTLSYPSKRLISSRAPEIAESDWTLLDWPALHRELDQIRDAAADLGVWTVVGAPHRLTADRRPHNSLYVFSDQGEIMTRYDKQRLSTTEITYMYTPGDTPVTFEVDGVRFGMALCLEILFPELFVAYAAEDVDVVLISSAPDPNFRTLAQAYALTNVLTISLAFAAGSDEQSRSGICQPSGWVADCPDGSPGLATADIAAVDPDARRYHRLARSTLYEPHLGHGDPRSLNRRSL